MASSTYLARNPQLRLAGFSRRIRAWDQTAYLATLGSAVIILAIVGLIVFELWISSQPTIKTFGWSFLTSSRWDPNSGKFGALPFIYGTCVTSFLALLIAVPFGVMASVFLAELAPPRLSNILTFLMCL